MGLAEWIIDDACLVDTILAWLEIPYGIEKSQNKIPTLQRRD